MPLDPRKGVALFTDGSCHYKDKIGGWAWVAIDAFENEEVGSGSTLDTTNNRMEMLAWVKGLDHLADTLGPCRLLVYCDSEYVVLAARDPSRARRKNRDLWAEIDRALDRHRYVEPIWVKGHHESHYNHLADELAGNARKLGRDEPSRTQ